MANWDERADALRREKETREASETRKQETAEEVARAEAEPRYEAFKDLASWVVKRYRTSGIPPIPIYATEEESVRTATSISWREYRRTQLGEAYMMHVKKYNDGEGDFHHVHYMVTPAGKILVVDDSRTSSASGRHFTIRLSGDGLIVYEPNFNRKESKIIGQGNLDEYFKLIEDWQAIALPWQSFVSMSEESLLQYRANFDKFLDEIVTFVDNRTRS